MNVDVLRRSNFIKIVRLRQLSFPGQVLVGEGTMVHIDDIIAEAKIPSELKLVDIGKGLGVTPQTVHQYLVRHLGEMLDEDDVIAKVDGRLVRQMRTPVRGLFVALVNGKAVIAAGHAKVTLKAGIRGVVESVIPEWGVNIEVQGSLLQGVWGNGKIGEGILKVLDDTDEEQISKDTIKEIEPDLIIASGVCLDESELISFVNTGSAGLIFSAVAPILLPIIQTLPIPVIVLQGFGDFEYDPGTLSILKLREGSRATINADQHDGINMQRPEVIIPGGEGEAENEVRNYEELAAGQNVLVLSGKNRGRFGEVVSLFEQQKTFESGLLDVAVEIKAEDGSVLQVPGSNLVILNQPG